MSLNTFCLFMVYTCAWINCEHVLIILLWFRSYKITLEKILDNFTLVAIVEKIFPRRLASLMIKIIMAWNWPKYAKLVTFFINLQFVVRFESKINIFQDGKLFYQKALMTPLAPHQRRLHRRRLVPKLIQTDQRITTAFNADASFDQFDFNSTVCLPR